MSLAPRAKTLITIGVIFTGVAIALSWFWAKQKPIYDLAMTGYCFEKKRVLSKAELLQSLMNSRNRDVPSDKVFLRDRSAKGLMDQYPKSVKFEKQFSEFWTTANVVFGLKNAAGRKWYITARPEGKLKNGKRYYFSLRGWASVCGLELDSFAHSEVLK